MILMCCSISRSTAFGNGGDRHAQMGNQRNRVEMIDRRHSIARADRIIWQVAFLSDEIGNTVRQELDILRFKAACRYFLKQMVFGFLPKSLQIMLVVVIDGLTRQGIQEIREWLQPETHARR